jgi:hypothetical protein
VRPLEDGSCTNREVKLALVATVKASFARRDAVLTGACWTGNAVGPETALKVCPGRLFVGEHLEKLKGADGRTAHGLLPIRFFGEGLNCVVVGVRERSAKALRLMVASKLARIKATALFEFARRVNHCKDCVCHCDSLHEFKVVDSRTEVKKKMRKSCG